MLRCHFKVNDRDKRRGYSSGTALRAADAWLWPIKRYGLCSRCSIFFFFPPELRGRDG